MNWDKHNLLTALVQNCPNVLEIHGRSLDLRFWTRILYLVTKGQLSCLKFLLESEAASLESYICTTFFFKASLTSLSVNIVLHAFGSDLNTLVTYQELLDNINEFTNLQYPSMEYQSNNVLSYFDSLIEDCQQLNKARVIMHPSTVERFMIEPGTIINPRPDIHEFESNWEIIYSESQLRMLCKRLIISDHFEFVVRQLWQNHVLQIL